MTATQAIEYIHSVFWKGSIPGLSRTTQLLEKMGNPQNQLKFVHIAGTNGKGSTAAMTASILRKAGYCTGLYTSPYIKEFNERMRFLGENIDNEELFAWALTLILINLVFEFVIKKLIKVIFKRYLPNEVRNENK